MKTITKKPLTVKKAVTETLGALLCGFIVTSPFVIIEAIRWAATLNLI